MLDTPERIAIAGAGVSGAWLYRSLSDLGRAVDVYDVRDRVTACGIHPCAWGVSPDFLRLMRGRRADPDAYITNRVRQVETEGRLLQAEVYLIDKPRLIRDLLEGAEVSRTEIPAGRYDRVLDCTGAARAYLPAPAQGDMLCETQQLRLRIPALSDNTIRIRYAKAGYGWLFPLGNHLFHVGAGAFLTPCDDLDQMLRYAGLLDDDNRVTGARRACACRSTIRMTGPHGALPHVDLNSPLGCPVWGVGESIGTVSPITGEGIMHAIRCAGLYLEHEDDPEAYSDAVLREFSWMTEERRMMDRAAARRRLSLSDWRILQRNAQIMGIRVGIPDALAMARNLRRRRRAPASPVPRDG